VPLTPREIVEAAYPGYWPTSGSPTNGYLRAALRALGVDPRSVGGNSDKEAARKRMLDEARRLGLDFTQN
jgi:hypothetical protein